MPNLRPFSHPRSFQLLCYAAIVAGIESMIYGHEATVLTTKPWPSMSRNGFKSQ